MQKLNASQVEEIKLKVGTYGRKKDPVIATLLSDLEVLQIGEGLLMDKSEWRFKSHPSSITSFYFKKTKTFTTRQTTDNQSWLIIRIR